jgi:hypothetical protein
MTMLRWSRREALVRRIAETLWERDPLAFLAICAGAKARGMTLLDRIRQRLGELKATTLSLVVVLALLAGCGGVPGPKHDDDAVVGEWAIIDDAANSWSFTFGAGGLCVYRSTVQGQTDTQPCTWSTDAGRLSLVFPAWAVSTAYSVNGDVLTLVEWFAGDWMKVSTNKGESP